MSAGALVQAGCARASASACTRASAASSACASTRWVPALHHENIPCHGLVVLHDMSTQVTQSCRVSACTSSRWAPALHHEDKPYHSFGAPRHVSVDNAHASACCLQSLWPVHVMWHIWHAHEESGI